MLLLRFGRVFIAFGNTKFTDVVIACNTAHIFADEIGNMLNMQPSSLIKATVNEVRKQRLENVGLLASPTTLKKQIFESAGLKSKKTQVLRPAKSSQRKVEGLIRKVIANKMPSDNELLPEIMKLQEIGAEKVILGCTELSVINNSKNNRLVIDPLELITNQIMRG